MGEALENPLEVPGLRLIFEKGSTDYADNYFTNVLKVGGSTENDPFSALPFEILELIVTELTLEDVSQLKQASQIYANLVLPDTFWHSQFRRGGEFEHVFESMEYGSQSSVFISTIDVFGLLYISGIRFEQKSGASTEVGYIHMKSEALVTWADSRPACVVGLQLAQDPRGIRGIAIESATGGLSNWVGEYDGIPRRRLVPHRTKREDSNGVALLQGGFDVILFYPMNAGKDDTETDVHSSHNDEPPAPQDVNIWYPEIPDPSLSFIGVPGLPAAYRYGQDEMPLSTILFGGLKGELLCHIVKMTV
ncbi:hypothetical protein VE02_00607 [Pseudogymnoascus sp. 03VT05]|nr:hypothetical protein VE02_00607 [Pseudogymnoascus sp. 03VT05]